MWLLDMIAWLVALPVATLALVFAIEVFAGLAKPHTVSAASDPGLGTAILMPAHDEELGIGRTMERLRAELPSDFRVLVVADNCSDRTAEVARAAGADVIERHDLERRGKGFALAFGRDHLRASPPDCVIVLDADCEAGAADYRALQAAVARHQAPVQANYLLKPDRDAPPMVQVSSFAMAVKNQLRQQGLSRLGAPVVLTGTGMAFPWAIFDRMPLATASIVEDLELGIHLAREGRMPRFEPGALVWSEAGGGSATLVQRSRWEGGFLATARQHALPLIAQGITRLRFPLLWLGLHLATPPLALLVMLAMAALVGTAFLAVLGASTAPLLAMLVIVAVLGLAIVAAWWKVGRAFLSPAAAARLPLYLLWKIPIYLKLARGGEQKWIRTERSR